MRRFAILVALACSALALSSGAASAHSDDGLIVVEARETDDETTVEVRARLTYANDGDPASGATVTVEGTGPSGEVLAPQPLSPDGAGIYAAVVALPATGTWKLRVVAVGPSAVGEVGFTTRSEDAATTTSSPPATPDDPTTIATDSGSSDSWLLPAAVVLIGVILGGGMFALYAQRRARDKRA
jgi:hypothetical protein